MMRLMGWKGGALGVRGEGLIEPIQPQLDVPSRVGLGHKKHESSKQNLNRLQKHILNRRAGLNQNEEYYEENESNEYEAYFNHEPKVLNRKDMTKKQKRKANKKARKEKRDRNKNRNGVERVNDLTIKRNRKIDLGKLKDICLKMNNNEKQENLNIDPLKLKTVSSEANETRTEKSSNDINLHNSNDLQKAEVNDLQGVSSVPNLSLQRNTTYIENSYNDVQYIEKPSSDDSAIQVSDDAYNQSLEKKLNRNCLQIDEEGMDSDDKILIIGDSDVQMNDDSSNHHDNIQVDSLQTNEENKDCSDKIQVIDDYASGVSQIIDDASYRDDPIQVIDNCLQTNDKGVRVSVDNNVMMNDDGNEVQNIDRVSNTNEEIHAIFAQTSDKRVSGDEDPFMSSDYHIQDVDNVSYQADQIEDNTNIQIHEEGDDECISMIYATYIDKHTQNINEVCDQTQNQDETYCELRNSIKMIVDESFQHMIDNIDKNFKYISGIFMQVEQMQQDTCAEITEGPVTDDNKNSQSIDKVDNSEEKQLNTNCVQINDKEVIRDDKYVIDVNDKDSQSIDEVDKSMKIQLYTNCEQVNDKEVIIEEKYVKNVNDKISQNIDEVDKGMQIQISDTEVVADDVNISIGDNDKNENINDVQVITNNVHNNDKEVVDNDDNDTANKTLYPDISDEGYEYYELDIGVKISSNRLVLLVNVLELVQSEDRFTIIRFPFKTSKKLTSYITTTIFSLNEREHVVFENEREYLLLKAIAREMTAHWDMRLVCRLRLEYRKQITTIIKSFGDRPVSGPFHEGNDFITTHCIPDYREYDGMPLNTKVEVGYHKLVNRIIRDFVNSSDTERVYEFTSQVEVKTYINAVIGLLNGRDATVSLGLGDTEYGVFCETVAGMEGVFLIARYDCPYLIFEKLQLVKVHLAKRCSICQQELNNDAISSNNDKNDEDEMNIEEIYDEIISNDSENISINSTSKQIQNSDVNEHEMDRNDFGREKTDSSEIKDVHSHIYENTKTCKNVDDKFDNIISSTVLACFQNECVFEISENIENMTVSHKKSDTEKSKEINICYNRGTAKTYDDVMACLLRNENVETDKVLEKPEETNNDEMEDVFDRLQYDNQSKDECLKHYFNDTSNNDESHDGTNNINEEDTEEHFNIENVKYNNNIYNGHKPQVNISKQQKYDDVKYFEKGIENNFEDVQITFSDQENDLNKEEPSTSTLPEIPTTSVCNNVTWPKSVIIMHKNHLEHKMDMSSAMLLQSIIYNATKTTQELPRLKCRGIKDDGVVYSCFDDKSYNWLVDTVSFCFKILDLEPDFKSTRIIELRINTLIKLDVDLILSNIETSHALNTMTWKVIQERIYPEYCVLTIEVDDNSLTVIKNEQYSLFVGFDRADVSVHDWA